MTKKEICETNKTIGYWSCFGGVEVKEIEYDLEDKIVCVSGAWNGKKSFHRLKVYATKKEGRDYINLFGTRLFLDECLRVSLGL